MSARFVSAKILGSLATLLFVVCFNFFLFRVVETDPVANMFRGHQLTPTQREELTRQFGLEGSTGHQFVQYLKQTATVNLARNYYPTLDPTAGAIGRYFMGESTSEVGLRSRAGGDLWTAFQPDLSVLNPDIVRGNRQLADAGPVAQGIAIEFLAARSGGDARTALA